ncbi:MAG: LysR family transcriptional regulator [Marivibrio sp.]|uniref:LysR family transcriptional regulator n=1 Tax=Marivibrio sp. TaxID=2039719 RepID=UPI0032ED22CC
MHDLSGIAVFAAVVEAGSFTKAGDKLGLSKSAVSKQITKLEERLGAQLMNRTTRRLSLTEVGQAFYERCRRIVAEAEEAELAVTRLQVAPRGILRLSAPVSFGIEHLGPALPDFMAQHPEVQIDMECADRQVDLVEEGFDMAVRIGRMRDSSLIAKRIAYSRRKVLAAPGYWAEHGKPAHPDELTQHRCLTYAYLQTAQNWEFQDPETGKPFTVTVNSGPLHSNNGHVLAHAAAGGRGVIYTPTFICRSELRAGRLESALDAFDAEPIGVHAVYPPNRHLSAKVRAFIDFLAARFAGPEETWP